MMSSKPIMTNTATPPPSSVFFSRDPETASEEQQARRSDRSETDIVIFGSGSLVYYLCDALSFLPGPSLNIHIVARNSDSLAELKALIAVRGSFASRALGVSSTVIAEDSTYQLPDVLAAKNPRISHHAAAVQPPWEGGKNSSGRTEAGNEKGVGR